MRPESVRALILGLALVAGCKPEPHRPDAAPPWWKPAPGEAADWDIQLAATPSSFSTPRAMYALELWKAVPAPTMLDYPSGPLAVPAGAHAGAIAQLHAFSPPAIVVCQIMTGAIRLTDPDASKFPGYEANPPNRPDPIAGGSVIGWSITDTDPNERWINIHDDARAIVAPLIAKRIELARTIGCDAIAAEHNDLPLYEGSSDHGFAPVSYNEYASWIGELSTRSHDARISFGLRNGSSLSIDDDTPAGKISQMCDWLMEDRCAEAGFCDQVQPFINRSKAVFAVEYDKNIEDAPNNPTTLCSTLRAAGIKDGIIKSAELSSAYYMRCM